MWDRKRFHDVMDEFDKFMDEMEKEIEHLFKDVYKWGEETLSKPMVYGFSVRLDPSGVPVIRPFGDRKLGERSFREPVSDQFVDETRGELKLYVELPGVERQDIQLRSTEDETEISTKADRKYRSTIKHKARVEPSSAKASYRNAVLEVTLKLKDKANKGYTDIMIE